MAAGDVVHGRPLLDGLVSLLDLERIEEDIFRGQSPEQSRARVFGGQVAGQALVAAGRTVPSDRRVHSLHAYFVRGGDPSVPIVYEVDHTRDGRSFATRRVLAIQHGKTIFALSASFQIPEPGLEHQDPMPPVPEPEALPACSAAPVGARRSTCGTSTNRPTLARYAVRRPATRSGCGRTGRYRTMRCCTRAS
jgi:acyl-CoA thioesterase-2